MAKSVGGGLGSRLLEKMFVLLLQGRQEDQSMFSWLHVFGLTVSWGEIRDRVAFNQKWQLSKLGGNDRK